jgi:pimeloyl-ACP methyl ester carboxylesterase
VLARSYFEGHVTLLLIHGWLADGSVWKPLQEILSQRYRVIAVDLRGAGASRDAPGPYRLESFASDLREFLRTLPSGALVLVGHSSGAQVAQRLALDAPHKIAGLVLIAPVPPSGWTFAPKTDAFLRSVAVYPEQRATWLATLTAPPQSSENQNILQSAAKHISAEVALASYESWTQANFAEEARSLRVPTLIIAPEHDRPITPDVVHERFLGFHRMHFMVLPDARHYAYLDQPERTADIIDDFLLQERIC